MILSALKRVWAFLGDPRLRLAMSGLSAPFVVGALHHDHYWSAGLCAICGLWMFIPSWNELSHADRANRSLKELASMLAGYQPIGAP